MRVAAGVLLIIAAVINLFAGLAYLGGGAMVGSMDKFAAMAEEQQRKQGTLTDAQKQQYEDMQQARGKMTAAQRAKMDTGARIAMAYGLFMLVTVGTSIAGAVCLFRRRAVKFIVVAAALALAVEVIGCVVAAVFLGVALGATKLVFSAIGIIGGCLALAGARQIAMANAVPVDAPPMTPLP
jgi:hypothetical protein